MRFPDREQKQLLKTNENLSETLLATLQDINEQLNTLDGQLELTRVWGGLKCGR